MRTEVAAGLAQLDVQKLHGHHQNAKNIWSIQNYAILFPIVSAGFK